MISSLQRGGALVFSCNNSDRFLRDNGITPNFHVMLDARAELREWVQPGGIKLYASMCDPAVLERAAEVGDLVVWHALSDRVDEVLPKTTMLVGGGETVGTRAMALAYVMGFRRMMMFGLDSSFRQAQHHAYTQTLNDGDRVIDCVVGGKRFKAAGWMIKQADDFKELAIALMGWGVEIAVTGDGLIAAVVAGMNSEVTEVDGFVWPSDDTQTRKSVLGTISDLEKYVGLCDQRRIAVQAGGNVGVWPKELAKYFGHVVTFEPDPLNYRCLTQNLASISNYECHQAALGDMVSRGQIRREVGNCGASHVMPGEDFDVVLLDSLKLEHCDLLQLDVEGFELFALRGAVETINRCSPLIVLELKGLGSRYGYCDSEVDSFLRGMRYQRIGVAHRDVIYKRVSNVT